MTFNYSQLTAGAYKVSGLNLLTTNSLKTIKGLKYDILSGVLYLAPHTTAGARANGTRINVCPSATAGCMASCLYRSGAALIYRKVNAARVRKTKLLARDPVEFMRLVFEDVSKIVRAGNKRGLLPAIRLNGTSDIRWERVPVTTPNGYEYPNIMNAFPGIQFYDYTKRTDRGTLPANYTLTFSRSEGNDVDALAALEQGVNVAVVFYTARPDDPLPTTWNGFNVIDGDLYDARFQDPTPCVVGLRPKAKARSDQSGFVIRNWETQPERVR